ncbi:MAG: hypothetical protein RL199_882, partial [Pseudomonadota bacterium]
MALFVVAAVACQSADATPDFVASASMLAGSSDPSLDLGAKWTKAAKITVSVTTPSGVATTEACLSLTDIASAGPNRVTPDVSPYTTCTSPDIKVSGFGALSPKTGLLTLPPGDGLKTVHARFRKADGKVAAVRSSTIVLDTLAPVFASDAASFAAKDSAVEVTLLKPATDVGGSGVASYAVYAVSSAYDAEAPALPGARGTTGTALTCVPLRNRLTCGGLVNGAQYALRLVPVDFAGNAAEGLTSGVLIPAPASHDGAAPAVSADSLRLIDAKSRSLLPGKAVNVAKLTLRLSATGPRDVKVGRYCLYEEGGACVWAKARTEAVAFTEDVSYELRKSVTGAAAEGPKALFAKFRDVLGGESPVVALSGLVYDVTKPVAPASASTTLGQGGFTLALSGAPSDAGSGLVPLNDGLVVSASTGTTEPAKGCTGPVVLSKSGAVWASPALKPGTSYRLRVCAVDRAGNVSDGAVASPAVVWRPTMNGPTGRVTAAPTRTAAFTLQIAATGDAGAKVASYFVSAASTLPEGAPFIAFSRPSATLAQAVTHTLSDTALDGARTFFVWLKDEYGNVGALGAQSVVLDTTAPAVTGVTLSLPRAAGATTSLYGAAVSVSLANPRRDASSGDPTAIRSVSGLYKLGASAFTAADKRPLACTGADLAWTCVAPAGLDVSQGRLQVAVTAVDAAGNAVTVRKEAAAALDAAPDTSAPDEVTGLAVMRSTSGTRGLLSWNGSLDDDVVGYLAVRSEGNVAPADCDGGRLTGSTSGTTLAVDGLDATKPYAFRVCAVDAAGNVSPGATTRPPGCTDDQPACVPLSDVPRTDARDYAFSSWPTNQRPPDPRWPGYQHEQHLLTGRYGAVFREETGSLTRLGAFQNVLSEDAARHRGNDDLAALPGVTLTWEAGPVDGTLVASQFLGDNGSTDIVARLSEGGRFMNRLEIPDVRYAGDGSLRGVVQVASMPRHLVLTEVVKGTVAGPGSSVARLRLGGPLLAGLPRAEWLVPGRAVRLTGHDGAGWLFVVYDAPGTTSSLTRTASGELVAERSSALPVATQEISLLAVPLDALNPDELAFYLAPETQVSVGYTLLDRHGQPAKAPVTVAWDRRVGAFHATLGTLAAAGLSGSRDYDARPELHDWYGRHRLTVDTHGRGPMAVPLLFEGTGAASLYITGGVALLRDASGEPVGVPVQLSKNWHDTTTGAWYRLFSQPVFSGLEPATLELTMVSSRWGADAYAASHAQLSLIGWNGQGARWDESAMGCFGESITYN